jgi:hypothetical protein
MSRKQFWVIDTESSGPKDPCESHGPFGSRRDAEKYITSVNKELWESSCNCLQRDCDTVWTRPYHIVEVVRTVNVRIEAKLRLEDVL